MRIEDGTKRLTEKVEILDRWKEHCKKLLNKESGSNDLTQIRTERLVEVNEEMNRDIRLYEVEIAIKQLKNWKAPGVDKIRVLASDFKCKK
jgi:predicted transglutaminase-like cysteine proteinase